MGRWIERHHQLSDVQIKILFLISGFAAATALLLFYTFSMSR